MRRHTTTVIGTDPTRSKKLGLRRNAYAAVLCFTIVCDAKADDDGCTVLLCLSNPAGWSAVTECVPPVQRALKSMAKGRVPLCAFGGGSGGSDARIVWVTENLPSGGIIGEDIRTVRVLEFRDTSGTIRRIKF